MFHSVVDVSGKKKLAGKTMSQNDVFFGGTFPNPFFIMPAHGHHDHHEQSYYGHDYDYDHDYGDDYDYYYDYDKNQPALASSVMLPLLTVLIVFT